MPSTGLRTLALGTALPLLLAPNAVRAEEERGFSADALLGYGVQLSGPGNAFGLGLGLRAGYTLPVGLFLGLSGVNHFGGTAKDAETRSLQLELGYEVLLGASSLRPYLGLGLNQEGGREGVFCPEGNPEGCEPFETEPDIMPQLASGLRFVHALGDTLQLGLDAQLSIRPVVGTSDGGPDVGTNAEQYLRTGLAGYAVASARFR